MNPQYDIILVAEFLRAKSFEKGFEIKTPMIQKMLYLMYGLYLAKYNAPLFTEQPRAWPSGPIFPSLEGKWSLTQFHSINDPKFDCLKGDPELMDFLDSIIKYSRRYRDEDLGAWLRSERAPWRKITSKPDFMWNDAINDADMKLYFSMFDSQAIQ